MNAATSPPVSGSTLLTGLTGLVLGLELGSELTKVLYSQSVRIASSVVKGAMLDPRDMFSLNISPFLYKVYICTARHTNYE